ncbi:hypothetical protein [Petralouisia muris]|uniref:hypothetical protein n=1 Tax=Petralouisia muris TaxID=3032872 RepID=UPI0010949EBA|nr:hypothetical protein [Petralouisia muris]
MGNERGIFTKIFRFLRDWDNYAATIFNRSQSAYLKNMQQPRAWGAESPSSLPGKQNPRSGFGVTLAKLAFYVRTDIKGIIREVFWKSPINCAFQNISLIMKLLG